jgi:cytochrome c biogenesis protein CcmG/thiol:disulfide interchange protein DsbE
MKKPFIRIAIVPILVLLLGQGTAIASDSGVRAILKVEKDREQAPAFRLPDASGRSVPLSSYVGKVVLLNFWATECGGCRVEIPWFMEFDLAYKSKGFQTLGVSMDIVYESLKGPEEGWARVKPFVTARKMNYPILMADDQTTKAYGVDALPTTYLIDKKGRIAATYTGLVDKADVESNLRMLLRER